MYWINSVYKWFWHISKGHITVLLYGLLRCRGEDPERGGAERVSGGDGDQHQELLGGAGAAAGSQGRAGLWERGEEQFHLGAHRRAKPTEGAPRAAEEEEEAQRRSWDVSGPRWESSRISEHFILVVRIFKETSPELYFPPIAVSILCFPKKIQSFLWSPLLCFCTLLPSSSALQHGGILLRHSEQLQTNLWEWVQRKTGYFPFLFSAAELYLLLSAVIICRSDCFFIARALDVLSF